MFVPNCRTCVSQHDTHPDLVGQRVHEGEDIGLGGLGFLDHNADPQTHKRLGEVDHPLSVRGDGQRGNCNVSHLVGGGMGGVQQG